MYNFLAHGEHECHPSIQDVEEPMVKETLQKVKMNCYQSLIGTYSNKACVANFNSTVAIKHWILIINIKYYFLSRSLIAILKLHLLK